jgi:hypothetical protein
LWADLAYSDTLPAYSDQSNEIADVPVARWEHPLKETHHDNRIRVADHQDLGRSCSFEQGFDTNPETPLPDPPAEAFSFSRVHLTQM